uniref:Class A beta-lactamase n=1 Tax=Neobacillus citreus TaxID=2833578 RepID=A0A942Y8F5_9BACI
MTISRKALLVALAAAPLAACSGPTDRPGRAGTAASPTPTRSTTRRLRADDRFAELEDRYGAVLGVHLLDTGSGDTVRWRADRRFASCSTHKVFTAAEVLRDRDDAGMREVVAFTTDDLVDHSPVTSGAVGTGASWAVLCEAAVRQSDNTAANLLFTSLGGPSGFQRRLRDLGDTTTRSDRVETDLNTAVPGDERDTTTPDAIAESLRVVALGERLPVAKRRRLVGWMSGNALTDTLIRAGLPDGWTVADKSGAGGYGTRNDIGVVERPGGAPIVLAVFSTRPDAGSDAGYDDALVAEAARAAVDTLLAA